MTQIMGNTGNLFWNFLTDEQGVAAIEYGLLAAGIAVAIIATVDTATIVRSAVCCIVVQRTTGAGNLRIVRRGR